MSDLIIYNQKSQFQTHTMHQELVEIQNRVYTPLGFKCSQPVIELESAEYSAYSFELNNFSVRFRVAKITPTKIGQFVTIWKRLKKGPIQPYDSTDSVDFLLLTLAKRIFSDNLYFQNLPCVSTMYSL